MLWNSPGNMNVMWLRFWVFFSFFLSRSCTIKRPSEEGCWMKRAFVKLANVSRVSERQASVAGRDVHVHPTDICGRGHEMKSRASSLWFMRPQHSTVATPLSPTELTRPVVCSEVCPKDSSMHSCWGFFFCERGSCCFSITPWVGGLLSCLVWLVCLFQNTGLTRRHLLWLSDLTGLAESAFPKTPSTR